MMQEAEAAQKLKEIYEQMNPGKAMAPVRNKYAKLRTQGVERRVECAGNLYEKARQALPQKGAVLEEEAGRLMYLTASGFGKRNLAVMELLFEEGAVTLRAWAKEGFIYQKTAEGAIQTVLEALEL